MLLQTYIHQHNQLKKGNLYQIIKRKLIKRQFHLLFIISLSLYLPFHYNNKHLSFSIKAHKSIMNVSNNKEAVYSHLIANIVTLTFVKHLYNGGSNTSVKLRQISRLKLSSFHCYIVLLIRQFCTGT